MSLLQQSAIDSLDGNNERADATGRILDSGKNSAGADDFGLCATVLGQSQGRLAGALDAFTALPPGPLRDAVSAAVAGVEAACAQLQSAMQAAHP